MVKFTTITQAPIASTVNTSRITNIQSATAQVSGAIDRFAENQARREQASIDTEVARKNSELNLRLNNELNTIKNNSAQDPIKGEQNFGASIDQIISDVSSDMTDRGKEAFKNQSYKYADTYKARANNWASTQKTANIFNNYAISDNSLQEQGYEAGKRLDVDDLTAILGTHTDNLSLYASSIEAGKLKELNEKSTSGIINNFFEAGVRQDPAQATAILNSGRFDKFLTTKQKDLLKEKALNQTLQNKNVDDKLKAQRPYSWLATQGESVADIDLSNSQELTNSLMDRQTYIDTTSVKYGTQTPFLTPQEEQQFMQFANGNDPDAAVDFMTNLTINGNDDTQNRIASQISKSDAVAAAAFSMSGENQQLAKDMLIGRRLLKDKSVTLRTQDKDLVANITDLYSDSIQDPVLLGQIVKATKAAYAANVYRGQEDSEETYQDILKQMIGDSAEVNGHATPTFIKNNGQTMSSNVFERTFEDLNIDTLNEFGQGNLLNPQELDNIKKYGRLLPVGDGKYNILMTTTNKFVASDDLKPYVLDMKSLTSGVEQREMNKLRKFLM